MNTKKERDLHFITSVGVKNEYSRRTNKRL